MTSLNVSNSTLLARGLIPILLGFSESRAPFGLHFLLIILTSILSGLLEEPVEKQENGMHGENYNYYRTSKNVKKITSAQARVILFLCFYE